MIDLNRGRWIDLTPELTLIGIGIGLLRQRNGQTRGANHREGFRGDPWENHIEGACAEIAAYLAINYFWSPSVYKTKEEGGDGGPYEVRRRSKPDHDLNFRPGDPVDRPYILVIGRMPRFRVVGWAWGYEIKQPQYWQADVPGCSDGWFLPQADPLMKDLDQLPRLPRP